MQVMGHSHRPWLCQLERVDGERTRAPRIAVDHEFGLVADHLRAGARILSAGGREGDGRPPGDHGPDRVVKPAPPRCLDHRSAPIVRIMSWPPAGSTRLSTSLM